VEERGWPGGWAAQRWGGAGAHLRSIAVRHADRLDDRATKHGHGGPGTRTMWAQRRFSRAKRQSAAAPWDAPVNRRSLIVVRVDRQEAICTHA
jgi:hypothetical protein